MHDFLQEICLRKREHIAQQKRDVPLAVLEAKIATQPPPRAFADALRAKLAQRKFGLIAEMKRASPSAGLIRTDYDPATLATAYASAGAACLSVLTDQPYFQGKDDDIARAQHAALPILRKDFMLDPYQVAETRALGADCILIIMAALRDDEAMNLHDAARHYQLEVLIETHDAEDIARALRLPGGLIGINNRNLKTLATDLTVTTVLAGMVPPDRLLVSESGLRTHADLHRMAAHGACCFLVGEHLVRQPNVAEATVELLHGKTVDGRACC